MTPEAGVTVAGYFRSELGVGEAGRLVLSGVQAANIPYSTFLYARTPSRQGARFAESDRQGDYRTNIICVNADQLPFFLEDAGPSFHADRVNVGVWWWEVSEFPDQYFDRFALVDEVWVGSEFVAHALREKSPVPVHVMPLPIPVPATQEADRASLGLPDGYTFLFSFDFLSVVERKNPHGLIAAFTKAFAPDEGPQLVIKSINGDARPEGLKLLRQAAYGRPDITIWDGYLDASERDQLVACADCYVSLHRSEGFGLTMAEAMASGKPVIATGYSGNLAFMNDGNSFLVPYKLGLVPPGCAPYPPGAPWAEADVEEAARLMREVVDSPDRAAAVGAQAKADIERLRTPDRLGLFILERLDALANVTPKVLPDTVPMVGQRSLPRRAARRALFRGLQPYTYEHQLEHQALCAQMEALTERVNALEAEAQVIGRIEGDLERLTAELTPWPYMSRPDAVRITLPDGREGLGFEASAPAAGPDDVYHAFEEVFRGPEDFIRERQRVYLQYVDPAGPVLDIGCGRGEFLDILREAGVPAHGVDLDPGMVARCRAKGHDVELGDGISVLAAAPDQSLAAVFCVQVIEHLSLDALLRLLFTARAKLRPGGVLIAETINPHALFAFKTFWMDPTHVSPLFPEVVLTLCQACGFASGRILFPAGRGELEHDRLRCGEYALLGWTTQVQS